MIPFDQPTLTNIQDAREAYWFILRGFAYIGGAWMAYEAIAWAIGALWRGVCHDDEVMQRSQERRDREAGE